jgi:hypothetical protein
MRIAKDKPELLKPNYALTRNLPGMEQYIALLSAPEEVKEGINERITETGCWPEC